ncbi:MAG: hypothetical protein HWN67_09895 [Candidatus Helarchaeota archaeon]|nr:hypothetical protein [Candidatus Helarchaeota archaeon]
MINTEIVNKYIEKDEKNEFKESISSEFDSGMDETQLDFYMPIEGTGDKYRIAEVCIGDNLGYYCVATSLSDLKKEIQRKGDKHFPGMLNSKQIRIRFVADYLVYSSVAGFIAKNAFNNVINKKVNDVEIPAYISIPNDAELTPIVIIGKNYIKDLKIKERKILAKYEIMEIASKFGNVKNAIMTEIDDEPVWVVFTDYGELFFNSSNGEKLEEIKLMQVI